MGHDEKPRNKKHHCLARKDPEVIRERTCGELNKRIEMEVKRGRSTRTICWKVRFSIEGSE